MTATNMVTPEPAGPRRGRPTATNTVTPEPAAPRRGRPRDAQCEQAILQATVALLSEVGFNQLSIEAVAARAGVGKPTIYRRWPSKPELVLDAVKRLAPPFPTADTGDPLTDLRQIVPELIVGLTSSPVARAIISLAGDPEMARRLVEQHLTPRREALADILRRAIAAGELRADTDVEMAMDLMLGAAVYRWLTTAQPVDAHTTRRFVDAVWDSLRPSAS
jgi:AcrR family transcriptional regulator